MISYRNRSNKSSRIRPSSASLIRSSARLLSTSVARTHSSIRRPQTSLTSDRQRYERIKRLRQKFAILARQHSKLNTSRMTNSKELELLSRRMELILDELERLQRQLKISLRKSFSKDQFESEPCETPLETLRKTKLLQRMLTDSTTTTTNNQRSRRRSRQTRPKSND